jgi:predicted DsbA family dithiol-disulfide isomerase
VRGTAGQVLARTICCTGCSPPAPLQNPEQFLFGLGDSLKLPKAKLTACLVTNATRDAVRDDAEGAVKAGAESTPTFYIEGGLLRGALPPEIWRPILDSIYLAKTRKP